MFIMFSISVIGAHFFSKILSLQPAISSINSKNYIMNVVWTNYAAGYITNHTPLEALWIYNVSCDRSFWKMFGLVNIMGPYNVSVIRFT